MFWFNLLLLVTPLGVPVLASAEPRSIFSISSIFNGFSTFASLTSSFKDIFNIILSSDDSELQNELSTPIPEDAYLNISRLVEKHGYLFQDHEVTTKDGYILTVHRITSDHAAKNGKVVFLMHGILASSDSWVLQGPNLSLAYMLADEGYDVWLGNGRGNKHSQKHERSNPGQTDFWEFTWEEIGIYDLPSTIDYILDATDKESLYYVGHSQGTTAFYVMSSLRPEYNEKVIMMFAMAPIAWLSHARSPVVRMFSPAYKFLGYFLSNLNTYSPSTDFFNKVSSWLCTLYGKRCESGLLSWIGDRNSFNSSMLPVILGHMSGSSTHQFVHYGQLVESGRFCRFDFGDDRNTEYYGEDSPPDYDLSKITVPVSLFCSNNDWLSDPSDVDVLKSNLPNVYEYSFISNFSHLDYLYAPSANGLVYSKIVQQINEYETTLPNFNVITNAPVNRQT